MRMNLVLELQDIPGQLVSVLVPIGDLGANLVTIIHQRDVKTEKGTIPVQLTLEGNQKNLSQVIQKLTELGIHIMEIDGVIRKEKITSILIGKIIGTDLGYTTNSINSIKGVQITDLELKLSENDNTTVKITVEADFGLKNIIMNKINEVADEKNLFAINEI